MVSTFRTLHLPLAGLRVLGAGPGAAAGPNRALHAAVARPRGEGLSNGAIVDHADASSCPRIARDDSLILPRKRGGLRDFAAQAAALVDDPAQDETHILLAVPVPSALSDQIDAAAAEATEGRGARIVRALQASRNAETGRTP